MGIVLYLMTIFLPYIIIIIKELYLFFLQYIRKYPSVPANESFDKLLNKIYGGGRDND